MFFSFVTYDVPTESGSFPFNTYSHYTFDTPWLSYAGTSTQDLIDYYANLLVIQYLGKPKAYQTIQAVVTPVVMNQLPTQVQNAFGVTTAVGVQLDILAKYIGVNRTGTGLDGQQIVLTDVQMYQLLQFGIINNSNSSSLAAIQSLIFNSFSGDVKVFDYANMQMSYYVNSLSLDLNLIEVVVAEGLLPKPMGVQLASVIYSPTIDSFFGCRTYELPAFDVSPLNTYSSYQTDYPMLSYADALALGVP